LVGEHLKNEEVRKVEHFTYSSSSAPDPIVPHHEDWRQYVWRTSSTASIFT